MVMDISKYPKNMVEDAIKDASSIKEVILNLGMKANNGNYPRVKYLAEMYGLELPKYDASKNASRLREVNRHSDEEYFKEGVIRNSVSTRQRLVRDHGVEEKCSAEGCPVTTTWLGKPITLQVDHIDGDRFNNKRDNLRLLCANCHTQTDTFGRKPNPDKKVRYYYCECGRMMARGSHRCRFCANSDPRRKKIEWPSVDVIIENVVKYGYLKYSKELGVSDNSIRKHLKSLGLTYLPKKGVKYPYPIQAQV